MRARLLALASSAVVALILIWSSLLMNARAPGMSEALPGQIALVLLFTVAAVPLRPIHTLGLGLLIGCLYLISAEIAGHWNIVSIVDWDPEHYLFMLLLTLMSTVLTAVIYAERSSHYRSFLQVLCASQDLRLVQTRMLVAEHSASLGRLAAALSHELNSPLGALSSAVDSLVTACAKVPQAPAEKREHLLALQHELHAAIKESVSRLRDIISRIQRFTNLDRAEAQLANVNALLSDVIALVEPHLRDGVKLELKLSPVRALMCRPQQLSAVFSNLLSNALNAISGEGRVVLSTAQKDSQVEITFEDDGCGIQATRLASIFDPGFQIAEGRVSTRNWSLFSSRQIVNELGGEIRITSSEAKGTTVKVTLPCQNSQG